MSTWVCRQCTAAYAVGLPACPQCGSTQYVEDWKMPKITREGLSVEQPPQAPAEAPPSADAGTSPESVGVPAPAAEPDPAPEPAPPHPAA